MTSTGCDPHVRSSIPPILRSHNTYSFTNLVFKVPSATTNTSDTTMFESQQTGDFLESQYTKVGLAQEYQCMVPLDTHLFKKSIFPRSAADVSGEGVDCPGMNTEVKFLGFMFQCALTHTILQQQDFADIACEAHPGAVHPTTLKTDDGVDYNHAGLMSAACIVTEYLQQVLNTNRFGVSEFELGYDDVVSTTSTSNPQKERKQFIDLVLKTGQGREYITEVKTSFTGVVSDNHDSHLAQLFFNYGACNRYAAALLIVVNFECPTPGHITIQCTKFNPSNAYRAYHMLLISRILRNPDTKRIGSGYTTQCTTGFEIAQVGYFTYIAGLFRNMLNRVHPELWATAYIKSIVTSGADRNTSEVRVVTYSDDVDESQVNAGSGDYLVIHVNNTWCFLTSNEAEMSADDVRGMNVSGTLASKTIGRIPTAKANLLIRGRAAAARSVEQIKYTDSSSKSQSISLSQVFEKIDRYIVHPHTQTAVASQSQRAASYKHPSKRLKHEPVQDTAVVVPDPALGQLKSAVATLTAELADARSSIQALEERLVNSDGHAQRARAAVAKLDAVYKKLAHKSVELAASNVGLRDEIKVYKMRAEKNTKGSVRSIDVQTDDSLLALGPSSAHAAQHHIPLERGPDDADTGPPVTVPGLSEDTMDAITKDLREFVKGVKSAYEVMTRRVSSSWDSAVRELQATIATDRQQDWIVTITSRARKYVINDRNKYEGDWYMNNQYTRHEKHKWDESKTQREAHVQKIQNDLDMTLKGVNSTLVSKLEAKIQK
jgi:hypothetical protein